MNNRIIGTLMQMVCILCGLTPSIYAQLNERSALLAKRYLVLHGTFNPREDLIRPDFKSLVSKVSGRYPRLYDSIEYKKLYHVSKNRAYSPKTGLTIEPYGKLLRIVGVHSPSPAANSGIEINDYIRVINGVYPMHIDHAWSLLEEKSSCSIEVLRGNVIRKHAFVSTQIPIKRIKYNVSNEILTINVHVLDTVLQQELNVLEHEISTLSIKEIVVDIRNIIGIGELKAALNFADEFIDDETELITLQTSTVKYVHTSVLGGRFAGIPLRVNIDSTVYGYGLILAGLLGAFADAELIGSKTSTDGSVQSFIKVQDSPVMYLSIPYANYEVEQCPPLDGRGLEPGKINKEHIVAR